MMPQTIYLQTVPRTPEARNTLIQSVAGEPVCPGSWMPDRCEPIVSLAALRANTPRAYSNRYATVTELLIGAPFALG